MRIAGLCAVALLASACASLPPGSSFPKSATKALTVPETTTLGRQFAGAAREHPGSSGFRMLSVGVDGFLARVQMIGVAERTLDLEYYIFRQDDTGQLLTDSVLRAADRGVRVRVLVDDGDTLDGDELLTTLGAHPNIEVRVFNPFVYRGHLNALRAIEFLFTATRLDYRMHNKLMVVDNAIALVGGRNVGDQYFQVDAKSQFGDDDVFAAGPIVGELSGTFDAFWNCALAIPAAALAGPRPTGTALAEYRENLDAHRRQLVANGTDYAIRMSGGEPLRGMLSGRLPLVWAHVRLVYDSPEKKKIEDGEMIGKLMHPAVAATAAASQHELMMVTPYLIPGSSGVRLLSELRARGVRVRILTNSLESASEPEAHSGYMHYRVALLQDGVELYEVRASLGSARGSGEPKAVARASDYALHAKLFVFDQRQLYVGSMNFDERSHHLNTEIGLIIDSPELARQAASRFEAITAPDNSYQVRLSAGNAGAAAHLAWLTRERGEPVEYDREPARSEWQRIKVDLLSLLPLDREL